MSSTNKTTNYELSQFIGSDKPAWLVDYNGDMSKIDNQMKANADAAASAASQASSAGTAASGAADGVQALNTQINGAGGLAADLVTAQGNINTINSLIGSGEPTTQDKTLIGAINELAAEMPTPTTGLPASSISYDNTTSGLTADDAQEAIDELAGDVSGLATSQGDLASLETTAKTSLVAAINEVATASAPNKKGTAVNISAGNFLTASADGYLCIVGNNDTQIMRILGADFDESTGTPSTDFVATIGNSALNGTAAIFVRKGMKMYAESYNTATATFTPLVS